MISFVIPGEPIAQPRQRIAVVGGHARSYLPSKHPVQAWKAAARIVAGNEHWEEPLSGPLLLTVHFIFHRPKNRIWKTKPMPREYHTKRPDVDNCLKSLMDALSGVIWRDDTQVQIAGALKWVAAGDEQPRTEVIVDLP